MRNGSGFGRLPHVIGSAGGDGNFVTAVLDLASKVAATGRLSGYSRVARFSRTMDALGYESFVAPDVDGLQPDLTFVPVDSQAAGTLKRSEYRRGRTPPGRTAAGMLPCALFADDLHRAIVHHLRIALRSWSIRLQCYRPGSPLAGAGHKGPPIPPGYPVEFEADETRVVQILTNLLHNAAKFNSAGGEVALAAHKRTDGLSLKSPTPALAFQPTRGIRAVLAAGTIRGVAKPGLGIGLALVRKLTELHGRSVSANSEGLNKGSTFIVRLPGRQGPGATPVR